MQDIEQWANAIRRAERRALARAITLVESERLADAAQAEALLTALAADTGGAIRVGVSGTPGVGKSTLIETLGQKLIAQGHRVAVLAVDPTSPVAGGSIMGDKTRMTQLAHSLQAYVRPSPARGLLGGLGWATPEAILLCEAAGFDVVLVESVGVGQSELSTAYATDVFVLLMQPFAGDDIQAMKRGVLELSDVVVINKADGDTAAAAEQAFNDVTRAFSARSTGQAAAQSTQAPKLLKTSASTGQGIDALWGDIQSVHTGLSPQAQAQRRQEKRQRLWAQTASAAMWRQLVGDPAHRALLQTLESAVATGQYQPLTAARQLYRRVFAASEPTRDVR